MGEDVVGTDRDPQDRSKVVAGLKSAGVLVASSTDLRASLSASPLADSEAPALRTSTLRIR